MASMAVLSPEKIREGQKNSPDPARMQLSSPSMVTETAPSRRRKGQSTLFRRAGAVSASPSPPEARDLDKLVLNLHRQAEIRGPPLHPRPERPSAAKGTNGLADGKNWISSRLLVAPLNCAEGRESSRVVGIVCYNNVHEFLSPHNPLYIIPC